MPNDTDVFISYAHADQEWVRTLAENLHRSGLDVFYDEWEIGAGDVLVHKLDAGILNTKNGIVVVSPTALGSVQSRAHFAGGGGGSGQAVVSCLACCSGCMSR